jgi:hypothetical protein
MCSSKHFKIKNFKLSTILISIAFWNQQYFNYANIKCIIWLNFIFSFICNTTIGKVENLQNTLLHKFCKVFDIILIP